MKANKTQATNDSVEQFIADISDDRRKRDAGALLAIMEQATGVQGKMWGTSIVGFGTYHYVNESGREGDTVAVGFSPRKQALVIYGLFHYEQHDESIALASQLGAHSTGKGCLYIKDLSEINTAVLAKMIALAYSHRANT
jgi:hypothetical protein